MHLSGDRPSVRPQSLLLWPGDIGRLLHGAQQRGGRMRAVPRCQRTRRS